MTPAPRSRTKAASAQPGSARHARRLFLETVGLQSPRGRLLFFGLATIAIFVAPYNWLANLSVWQALGVPSPSIGLTRAYHLLLHGDFVAAWDRNPLIFVVLFIGLPLLAFDLGRLYRDWRYDRR